jgi:hypothetical protein
MPQISTFLQLRAPLGGQEIELQHFVHDGGGMPLLRVRIRERRRFTVFEIDRETAAAWGAAMLRWSDAQAADPAAPANATSGPEAAP